jgi:hypothetical protein
MSSIESLQQAIPGEGIVIFGVIPSALRVVVSFAQLFIGVVTLDNDEISKSVGHYAYAVGNMASVSTLGLANGNAKSVSK